MKRTLHLVRSGEPIGVAEGDWIVYLDRDPIDYDQLVVLIFTADRVVTW